MKGFAIAVQSAADVSLTCGVLCFYIKTELHYLVQEKPGWSFIKLWACGTFPECPLSHHSFPGLLIKATNYSLVLEVWVCSRDFIMQVRADMKVIRKAGCSRQ